MRLPPRQISSELARINERGRAFKDALARSDYVAVCLVGYEKRVPRDFGDNHGAWPVRVAVTTNPKEITRKPNQENPLHAVRVHELVWLDNDAQARRLKSRLEELLLGNGEALRFGWKDCDDPLVLWPILLSQALQDLGFDAFDEFERQRRVTSKALKSRR